MYKPLIVSGEADRNRKSCYDCYWCQGAVSWWCVNEEAIKARGTKIPGICQCPYWKPATHIRELNWFQRNFEIFRVLEYVDIKGKLKCLICNDWAREDDVYCLRCAKDILGEELDDFIGICNYVYIFCPKCQTRKRVEKFEWQLLSLEKEVL